MFKILELLFFSLTVFSATSFASPNSFNIDAKGPLNAAPVARSSQLVNTGELTNAARLARGLPPLAPKFRRFLPGDGTPTVAAREINPSLIPVSGKIQINRAAGGGFVGYIKKTYINSSSSKRFGLTTGTGSALTVAFTAGVNPFEITETNGPDPSNPFLGGVVASSNNNRGDLASGSANYIIITGTRHTGPGSPPAAVGNSYSSASSESTIWSYNLVTKQLTAQWINSNGAAAPTFLYYLPSSDSLLLVGDRSAINSALPGGYEITFTVV